MKYSRSAITQLNKWYKQVLIKCALLNAAVFVMTGSLATNANASLPAPTNGDDAAYTWKTSGANTAISASDGETTYYVDIKKTTYNNGTEDKDLSYLWDNDAHSFTVNGVDGAVKTDGTEYVGNHNTDSGGALNNQTGNVSGWFISNSTAIAGGAIRNSNTPMGVLNGHFIGNTANTYGGAIFRSKNTTNSIIGDFIGNSGNEGGAIHSNNGTFNTIIGDFIGNTAKTGNGGAINNIGSSTIGNITGNFINNKANNYGGAIHSEGTSTIGNITGTFINNTSQYGGAVSNYNSYTYIVNSDFIGNTATQKGGAIYNYSTYDLISGAPEIFITDSSFIGNTAEQGSAIYSETGAVKITAKNKNVEFSNNTTTGDDEGYAIYMNNLGSRDSLIELNAAAGKTITINDKIYAKSDPDESGVNYFKVNSDANDNGGTIALNNKFVIEEMQMYNGELKFGQIQDGSLIGYLTKNHDTGDAMFNLQNNHAGDSLVIVTLNTYEDIGLVVDVNKVGEDIIADIINVGNWDAGHFTIKSINFLDESVQSGEVSFAGPTTSPYLFYLDPNADTGIYTDVSYSEGKLHFADPVSWAKRTLGTNSAYKWTKTNTGLIPTIYKAGTEEKTFYVDILKKTYTDSDGEQTLTYAWDNDTRRFSVTPGGTAVKTDGVEYVGNSASDGAGLKNPESASGWFIGNTAANYGGAIYNSGTMSTINGYFIGNNANYINYGGGAIYNSGNITTVTSDFIGNFATRYGGAIYNTGTISNTTGDFIGNYAGYGGAITNFGTMTNITGNFINNGGGTYNRYSSIFNRGTIENLNANFIGNAVTNNSGDATVYNQGTITNITGDFIGNNGNVILNYSDDWNLYYARVDSIDANFIDNAGTAIYNSGREATVQMGSINGTFQNNGQGIYLGATTMTGGITGTFENNGRIEENFYGGAIYANSVNVNSISGSFTGNKSSQGGAIFNYSYYGNNYITSLSGTFSENEANYGGAINNMYATITSLSGTFTNNTATQVGGAIYNSQKGLINISNSTFTGNSADVSGGAIYNFVSSNNSHPTINIVDSSFTGNISPVGAAIYSDANTGSYQCTNNCAAIVKITAQNDNIVFTNNNSTGTAEGTGYGIWIGNGSFDLNANTNKSITINDAVYSRPVINVNTDENYNAGTVVFNNLLYGYYEGVSINLGGGTLKLGQVAADNTEDGSYGTFTFTNTPVLDLQNNSADTTYISQISGDAKLKIDVNVTSTTQSADMIVLDYVSSGTLTLDSLNMIGDANPDGFTVNIMQGYYGYLDGITVNISDDLAAQYAGTPTVEDYDKPYVYSGNITFDTTDFTTEKWTRTTQKHLSVSDYNVTAWTKAKQLKLDVGITDDHHKQDAQGQYSYDVIYDALQVLNQHEGIRTLTAEGANVNSYVVGSNLGNTAVGRLSVVGVSDVSILNMNNKTGFVLNNADDTELGLYNLNIVNVNDTADGGLINISGDSSSAVLSNVTIENTNHVSIINDQTLKTYNDNYLGQGIKGAGNTYIKSGTTIIGSFGVLEQNNVLLEGGRLFLDTSAVGTTEVVANKSYAHAYTQTDGHVNGGALRNLGTLTLVSGEFKNNSATSVGDYDSLGGAVFNKGTLDALNADFTSNSVYSVNGGAFGGALYNKGQITDLSGTFTSNTSSSTNGNVHGGAIVNEGTIDNIVGSFDGNSVTASDSTHTAIGGALLNFGNGYIDQINANFTNNSANGDSQGGAIYNLGGTINVITGDFENNSAKWGGAVVVSPYNTQAGTITTMNSNFTGNSADYGGALYVNTGGVITTLNGDFTNNSSTRGGAIFNRGTISALTGDFVGNSATLDTLSGGAIYSTGTGIVNLIDSSFKNNIGIEGAAIFVNSGTVNVTATAEDIEFTNNNTTGTASGTGSGIQTTANGTLGLKAENNHKISINDTLALNGATQIKGGAVVLGQKAAASTSNLGALQFSNAPTLDLQNGAIQTTNAISVQGNGNLNIDIDLTGSSAAADVLNLTTGGQTGAVTIAGLNFSGTLANFEVDVFTGQTEGVTLGISDDLMAQYTNNPAWENKESSDTLTQDASWTDTFTSTTWQERYKTTLETVDNTKLKYTAETQKQNEQITTGETLALLNQASQFGEAERTFTTTDATATHDVTADLGTTAAGKVSVQGATDGTNTSTIDLKGKNGFTVGNGATVLLDTVDIIGAKAADGSLINNTAGTVELNNVNVAASTNDIIENAATMNLTGENNIAAGVDGAAGVTNVLSGTTTFGGNLSQATVNVSSNATLNADASDVSAALANDGTMNLSGATNANDITGTGTTLFSDNMNNTGDVTQSSVTVASGKTLTNGGTISLTNALNADAVVNGGILNLNGANMTLDSAVSGGGTLNVNGNVTLGDAATVTSGTTTVADEATFDIAGKTVNLGNATINGTVKLEITDISTGSSTYTGGKINANNLNLGSDSKLSLTIAPNLIDKKTSTGALDIVNVSGVKTGQFAEMVSNNRYKFETDDEGKITITNYASVADIVMEGGGSMNDVAGGEVWDELIPQTAVATAVQNRLNYLSQHDANGYVDALNNLIPTDSMTMVGVTQDLNNLIDSELLVRLDSEGMNSGDVFEKRGAWVQTLYNHSKQNDSDNVQGFSGDTVGVALGVDGDINDSTTLGLGYAYSYTDVDAFGRDMDIKGHTFYLYGKYQPDAWYVRGMANYGFAKYKEKANVGGIINHAEYDVKNYGARAYFGYNLPNGLTPEAGLRIAHIKRGSYVDSFGQHVKTDGVDVLTASAGLNYKTTVETKGQQWTPKARIAFTYDLLSDNTNATVNMAGGVYNIKGKRLNRFGVETGVGAEINMGQWDFSAEYDFGIRKNYLSHTGMLKAKYNF